MSMQELQPTLRWISSVCYLCPGMFASSPLACVRVQLTVTFHSQISFQTGYKSIYMNKMLLCLYPDAQKWYLIPTPHNNPDVLWLLHIIYIAPNWWMSLILAYDCPYVIWERIAQYWCFHALRVMTAHDLHAAIWFWEISKLVKIKV